MVIRVLVANQHILESIFLLIFFIGCGPTSGQSLSSSTPTSTTSSSEISAAIAAGASASAAGVQVGWLEDKVKNSLFFNPSFDSSAAMKFSMTSIFRLGLSLWENIAWAGTSCPTYQVGDVCTGTNSQTFTANYSGCSFGASSATWKGGQTLVFGGGAVCGTTSLPVTSSGETLSRMFTGAIGNSPTSRTNEEGVIVYLDTSTPTGWQSQVSGGGLVTGLGSLVGHSINVQGINVVASSKQFNFTLNTVSGQPLVVYKPAGMRTITSGQILIQHNLAKYTGITTFTNVGLSSACCYATSGSVTTTFTGGTYNGKTETLAFSSTCGSATYTAPGASTSSTIQLTHCF